jgi:hypothetical protein
MHCANKAVLCLGSNDVDVISEDVLKSLDGQFESHLNELVVMFHTSRPISIKLGI